jgi:glutaredoxin 3
VFRRRPTIKIEERLKRERKVTMSIKKIIEVFTAGCPTCEDAVRLVNRIACPGCEVTVLNMNDAAVAARARSLGVRSVPAVAVDGRLADCCAGRGPDETGLRAAGVGRAD